MKKLDEVKAPSLWRDLHRGLRRQPGEPLLLSEAEYEGCESEFVAREVPRRLKLKEYRQGSGEAEPKGPVELTEPEPDVIPRLPTPWSSIDEKTLFLLDMLQLRMCFAETDRAYRAAEKEYDALVRPLKPKKQKINIVEANVLPLLRHRAERIFFWAVLKGDYVRYRNPNLAIRRLKEHYGEYRDLSSVCQPGIFTESPQSLALHDTAKQYGIKPDSLRVMLSRLMKRARPPIKRRLPQA